MTKVHELANGVRVVADSVPGFQTLALTVAAGRGARSEGEAEAGWAHLLEHMVLKGEVGVIAQEIAEAADTPDDFVFELAQSAAFAGQPLGRPVLGTEASIGAAVPASLEAWRAGLYAPDRLVVSAAGAVDE